MTRADLIRWGPYRVIFPLGVLGGLWGVGHWVLWSVGWLAESNPFFHASMQVQGFLTCFVVGFLMTALPRFLGAPPARLYEVACAVTAIVAFQILSFSKQWMAAQAVFLALLGLTILFAGRRLPYRTKRPPGSFLLIGFGLTHALVGSALMLASGMGRNNFVMMEIGRHMLQIGFLLCLVLGIAGYLAPFLTGYAGDPSCDPEASPLRGTGPAGLSLHALTGSAIFASFLIEPHHARWAAGIRAIAVLTHLILFARIYRFPKRRVAYAYFFWIACWMVPSGLWSVFLWPEYRLGGLHLLFIGGFSLMIFSFGSVVVLSHGAQAYLLNGPLIPLKIVGVAVLLAAVMRLTADLDAWRYKAWIHAASGTWVLAAGFWLIYIFPKLWQIPPVERLQGHAPKF